MIEIILLQISLGKKGLKKWSRDHIVNLSLFNFIVFMLLLLRSAGYFHPFFLLSINVVIFITLICAIVLLNAGTRWLFAMAALFWIFASFMRILKIDVWAERTAIYTYQSLLLGVALMIIENIKGNFGKPWKDFFRT
ncbi:MAG: hypothetical protein UV74_C0013G0317 [Candidatus Woesebacteria bacterium GW2011_GWB1_43_14]|uniref:Uncharacterized protein n=1 Tax=Candidatus Woesebacteria bacterium GW2011_GWB1_43_14 TaxID=1618578 RepID=A0A0G1DH65_9BACT|nr:MAG: hypothetical protein UT21_C0001G0027 [Candidatus Woesebacteria bacterium GW2011_GWA1_39_11b]KKS78388.1 MAG: hypothetical protein UV51_C0001G0104 [Candidatus Woesebacteria bacterium GW2011_GWC1_42_9]KKS97195.1 MAG: hypothetical protein UV74_C0013G0317 [Candidatus Woesebacteria bacterium GW2011_GWB1_43_14]